MRTDEWLLEAWRKTRDEDAFRELVRRHTGIVMAAARSRLAGAEGAEDVAQQAFILLAQKPPVASAPLGAWLWSAATRLANNHVRQSRRSEVRERIWWFSNRSQETEMSDDLTPYLRHLSSAERELILLRFAEELTFAEIGLRRGISEDAARMGVNRALQRLRKRTRKELAMPAIFAGAKPAPEALAEVALSAKAAPLAGLPLLLIGVEIMTNTQKFLVGAAILATFLFGGVAIQQQGVRAAQASVSVPLTSVEAEELVADFLGLWKGSMQFVDASSGRKQSVPSQVQVTSDGDLFVMDIRFDDESYNSSTRVKLEKTAGKTIAVDQDTKERYEVIRPNAGRVELVGSATFDGQRLPARTILENRNGTFLMIVESGNGEGEWTMRQSFELRQS